MSTLLPLLRKAALLRSISPEPPYEFATRTQEVIDRAISEGFDLISTSSLISLDKLIRDFISEGILAECDILRVSAHNDLNGSQFSRINIAAPRGVLETVNGAVTYDAYGRLGAGGDVKINYNPNVDGVKYTLNDAGRGAVLYVSGGGAIFGTTAFRNIMVNSSSNVQRLNSNSNNLNAVADLSGEGLKSQYRDSTTSVRLYSKEIEMIRTQTSSTSNYSLDYYLMSYANSNFSEVGISMYYLSASLPQAKNTAIRVAMNSHFQRLGLAEIA